MQNGRASKLEEIRHDRSWLAKKARTEHAGRWVVAAHCDVYWASSCR
jgi:hypothetical protein